MDFGIYAGDTNKTIYVRLRDSTTGLAKTGLVYNSAGAVCSYVLPLAARAAIALATQTVTGAHSDGGFVEVDATNCKGLYRLDLSDAAIASGDFVIVSIEFDGIIEESIEIPLHTRAVNITQIGGVAQSATDLKHFADTGYNPATSKVQGVVLVDTLTTYTGNTLQTADHTANISAIKTKTDFLPSATAGATGGVFIAGTNAATTVTGSFTTTFTGTLTGDVGGNVIGTVGSVTGAVGSVTGNVGGNVTGSVGSVVGHTVQTADVATLITTVGAAGVGLTAVALADATSDAVIADAVWNAATVTYGAAGSYGEALEAVGAAADPWLTNLPGAYGAGTAGKIIGDNLDAAVTTRAASATALTNVMWTDARAGYIDSISGHTAQTGDTYALANGATGFVAIDTVVDAILVDTNTTLPATLAVIAGYLDTEIAAIKAVTDVLPDAGALTAIGTDTARLTAVRAAVLTDWIDGGRLDVLLDAIPTTAMRGTDSAALASVCTEARLAELDAANLPTDLAAIAADLPSKITKNVALNNFGFLMIDSTDDITGKTGLTVTATRSIDGAAFAACTNAVSEVANGIYKINLSAADMNGDVIVLQFTATGANARFISIVTQPT